MSYRITLARDGEKPRIKTKLVELKPVGRNLCLEIVWTPRIGKWLTKIRTDQQLNVTTIFSTANEYQLGLPAEPLILSARFDQWPVVYWPCWLVATDLILPGGSICTCKLTLAINYR